MSVHGLPAELGRVVAAIRPPAEADPRAVRAHLNALTKPPGSLGELEELAFRLALIYGDPPPALRRHLLFVLVADHGVASRGVSAYPPRVTAQMCRNFARGGAAVSAIASAVGTSLVVVDIGVDAELRGEVDLLDRKVRRGSRDLSVGPALSRADGLEAIETGVALVRERVDHDLFGLGEMGIGNTTAASALTAALTGARPEAVVGPGTGVQDERLTRKREIIRSAVARLPDDAGPLDLLERVGGLEIGGLVGITLGAAASGRAVVTDGFIATAAALLAVRICPDVRHYLFASHLSTEPGHRLLLDTLGLRPPLDLRMRLGEGTGAALAFPTLQAAAAILRDMATFESAGISGPDESEPGTVRRSRGSACS